MTNKKSYKNSEIKYKKNLKIKIKKLILKINKIKIPQNKKIFKIKIFKNYIYKKK